MKLSRLGFFKRKFKANLIESRFAMNLPLKNPDNPDRLHFKKKKKLINNFDCFLAELTKFMKDLHDAS